MKPLIKEFHIVGKEQMKEVAIIANETKNDMMKKGGFAPS